MLSCSLDESIHKALTGRFAQVERSPEASPAAGPHGPFFPSTHTPTPIPTPIPTPTRACVHRFRSLSLVFFPLRRVRFPLNKPVDPNNTTVFVGNLRSGDVSAGQLETLFKAVGPLSGVRKEPAMLCRETVPWYHVAAGLSRPWVNTAVGAPR